MNNGYKIIKVSEEIEPLSGVGCEEIDGICPNIVCCGDLQCCNADPFCDCLMECYCATNDLDCSTRIGNR